MNRFIKREIEFRFTQEEAVAAIAGLREAGMITMAARLQDSLDWQIKIIEADAAVKEAEQQRRAERAAHAILTKRQAECLAAVRAGEHAFRKPYYWTDNNGVKHWRWQHVGHMGGAVARMVEGLVEEGLLDGRRNLTDAGLARLEAWETEHGKIGGE